MDELKDTQKTDSISRYIDEHAVRTNPFGENRAAERAYRRGERIAAALHLLTNHVPADEPVRGSLRHEAGMLLETLLSLRSDMRAPQSASVVSVQAAIRHLISLVRILTVSGYVSIQNANTMVEALDELGNFMLASQRSVLSEQFTVSREDLLDVRGMLAPLPGAHAHHGRAVKDIKDSADVKDAIGHNTVKTSSDMNRVAKGQVTIRSQSIIEILRVGGSLGIKDICSNLPEYSEKMIQRELMELVSRGMVRRSGLKRWSRYSIAA